MYFDIHLDFDSFEKKKKKIVKKVYTYIYFFFSFNFWLVYVRIIEENNFLRM